MPDIRDSGFGLNYNRGFGSRGGFLGGTGVLPDLIRSGSDRMLQGRQIDADRGNLELQEQGDTRRAQIAADASRLPALLQQGRFNTILPHLLGQLNQPLRRVGGRSGAGPEITAGPVWNGGQIQNQVNAARAQNDAAVASQNRRTQEDLGAKGYASSSPLLMALQSGQQMAGRSQNAADAREIRWGAAQGNAEQLLRGQVARENQFANRMAEDIERRKAINNNRSAVLAALAGIV